MEAKSADPMSVIQEAKDLFTARRVIGEPYEKNGVTLIPVVTVGGGGGGGGGEDTEKKQSGSGAGFGMGARPVGAYVIRGDEVKWLPALDVTRVAIGGQIVAVVLLLVIRSIVRSRTRRARLQRRVR